MANTFTIEQAKAHLEDLVAGAENHEEWLVVDSAGGPIAKLAVHPVKTKKQPVPNTDHAALLGMMEGQINLLPGWDDPLDEFEPYA